MSENNGWIKCSDVLPAIFDHNGYERSDVVMCFGIDQPDYDKTYVLAYMIPGIVFMALMANVRRLHIGDHYQLHQMIFRFSNKTHLQPIKSPPNPSLRKRGISQMKWAE